MLRIACLRLSGRGAAVGARRLTSAPPEALGFSSPGNSGTSEEMKEVGRPHEVRDNEEAMQRHGFSEKDRFSTSVFGRDAQSLGTAAAAAGKPGGTGGGRAVEKESMKLADEDITVGVGKGASEGGKFDDHEPHPDTVDGQAPDFNPTDAPHMDYGARVGSEGDPSDLKEAGDAEPGGGGRAGAAPKSETPRPSPDHPDNQVAGGGRGPTGPTARPGAGAGKEEEEEDEEEPPHVPDYSR